MLKCSILIFKLKKPQFLGLNKGRKTFWFIRIFSEILINAVTSNFNIRIRTAGSDWDRTSATMPCFCSESQRFARVLGLQIGLFLFCYQARQSVNRQLRLFSVKLLTTDPRCVLGKKQDKTIWFFFLVILFKWVKCCLFQRGCWWFVPHKSQPTGSGDLCLCASKTLRGSHSVFPSIHVTPASWQAVKWVFSLSGQRTWCVYFFLTQILINISLRIWWNQ